MNRSPTLADTFGVAVRICPIQTSPFGLRLKLRMHFWKFVQRTLFRWSPGPARGFRRSLLRCFGGQIAATASIHNTARIDCPWNLEMGERASLGEESWAYALDKIVIGENACIGQRTILLTGSHDFSDPCFPLVTEPIVIGYGAWLAVGVTVLPGVKIGALTVIGAASVVTKEMPKQMICAGNPCRPIKEREFRGGVE